MSVELVVDNTKNEPESELQTEALAWPDRARGLRITDAQSYTVAGVTLTAIKALRDKAEATFRPAIDAAHKSHKEALKLLKEHDTPLAEAETIIKKAIADWDDEQDRLEAIRTAELTAQAAERDEQIAIESAAALESAGLVEEAAATLDEALTQPATVVTFERETPKVSGVSVSKDHEAEVFDLRAFLTAAMDDKVLGLLALVSVDQKKLNRIASTFKGALNIPGVRVTTKKTVRASAR